ncbi:hypothetical protein I3760_15G138500 [Carya illinoinensis]|nr:hypothetical protein I3760_15G138500 [Carya illinoinensis]
MHPKKKRLLFLAKKGVDALVSVPNSGLLFPREKGKIGLASVLFIMIWVSSEMALTKTNIFLFVSVLLGNFLEMLVNHPLIQLFNSYSFRTIASLYHITNLVSQNKRKRINFISQKAKQRTRK